MDELLPSTVFGLPLHPLVVHAAVVVVPLTALVVLLAAVVPAFRRWAGWLPLVLAVGSVVLTRVATGSGATLQRQQAEQDEFDPRVAAHQELGEQLIWYTLALLVVALVTAALWQREPRGPGAQGAARRTSVPPWLTGVVAVAGVLVPLGAVVQTVRIGHSGAESVWTDEP